MKRSLESKRSASSSDEEDFPDFNPPPIFKKDDKPPPPRNPSAYAAVMQVLAPGFIEEVDGQVLQSRLERFVERTHPEQRVKSWGISDRFSPRLTLLAGHGRTVAGHFQYRANADALDECSAILSRGPRRVLFRKGGEDVVKEKKRQVDAVILEMPLAKVNEDNVLEYAKEVHDFFNVYWGKEGAPQIATYDLAIQRMPYLDGGAIEQTKRSLLYIIDEHGLRDLPQAIRQQILGAGNDYQRTKIIKAYRQPYEDAYKFVTDVLENKERFNGDKKAAGEGVANLVVLLAKEGVEFDWLDNFARAAAGDMQMNMAHDKFGMRALSRDYHQLVQMLFVAELAWSKVSRQEGANVIHAWAQRVFIRVRTSVFGPDFTLENVNKPLHGWLYADEADAFERIPYILPALYAIHPELLIQKGISAFKPLVRRDIGVHPDLNSSEPARKYNMVTDKWEQDKSDDDRGSKGVLTQLPRPFPPMIMSFVNGKYKA